MSRGIYLQGSEKMGRKKKDDEEKNKSITISIQPSVLRRIDLVPGMETRSWKINRLLNFKELAPKFQ